MKENLKAMDYLDQAYVNLLKVLTTCKAEGIEIAPEDEERIIEVKKILGEIMDNINIIPDDPISGGGRT